jgi:hypothetical protein
MLPLKDAIRGSIFVAAPPLNHVPHVLPATHTTQLELKLSLATTYAWLPLHSPASEYEALE